VGIEWEMSRESFKYALHYGLWALDERKELSFCSSYCRAGQRSNSMPYVVQSDPRAVPCMYIRLHVCWFVRGGSRELSRVDSGESVLGRRTRTPCGVVRS